MKLCKGLCGLKKDEHYFNKRKSSRDGLQSYCKECQKIDWKKRDMKIHKQEYRKRDEVKNHEREYKKKYYIENKDQFKENKENNKPQRNKLYKERYSNDYEFLASELIRNHIRKFLKSNKDNRTSNYLKCTVKFFKLWIEFQFDKEMSWDNHGNYWHLDHIIPKSLFNNSVKLDQYICCHWTNFQPLSSNDNLTKNNNLRLYEKMNSIINVHRFIQKTNFNFEGYQALNESLKWLREKYSGMVKIPVNEPSGVK